ncbi:MAG: SMC family ATPase [Caldimicrobium sp.]
MRPLYLSVKGFGPYLKVELTEETFRLIHQERLFLITGEIGAGKTTLFDAILFSLFGDTAFPERSPKDLISHLLKQNPQFIPEVVFKFFFNGKTFQIVRRPAFGRYNSSVSLWINEVLYSQKHQEVTQKIKEIFGLEAKQFKKIFLIPQGEYRKVLLSEPKERKELFEKLFDTEFLTRLEEFFKSNVKALKDKLNQLEVKEKEILGFAEVSSPEELEEKINKLSSELLKGKKELDSITSKLNNLSEEIKRLERGYELLFRYFQLEEELKTFETKRENIEAIRKKVIKLKALKENLYHYENIKKLWSQLREKTKQKKELIKGLFELQEKISEVKGELEPLKEKEHEIEKLKEILFQKEEALKGFERYKGLLKALKDCEEALNHLNDEIEKIDLKEKALKEKLNKLSKEKELLRHFLETQRKLSELKEKERDLNLYKERIEEKSLLLKEREALEKKKKDLSERLEIFETQSLAVKLAESLKEGEPCPVCGSKVHPHKAQRSIFLSGMDNLKKELEETDSQLEKVKTRLSQIEGELFLLKKRLPEDEILLNQKIKEHEENLKDLRNYPFTFEESEIYEEKEKELNKELETLLSKRKTLEERFVLLKEEKGKFEGELKALKEIHLKEETEEELREEIVQLKRYIQEFENKKFNLEEKLKNFEREFAKKQAEFEGLERELKDKVFEYRASLKSLKSLINKKIFGDFKEMKIYYKELESLERYEEEIFSFEESLKIIKAQLQEIEKNLKELSFFIDKESFFELEKTLKNLNDEKAILSERRDQILGELKRLEEIQKNLERYKELFEKIHKEKSFLEEEYPYLEKIFLLLSGGSSKISFHSYALSKYLSLILRRASSYLSDFTLGRYRFVEGEIFTKQFILEIFDNYTGTKREVKTLSGGESFLASLSFALSSADILFALSKRGAFETLLIDEGFGSLDENSLERVIQGLLQLSQRTGKIVGIISHLRDLKERFPVVIEVIKNKEKGSQLKVWRNF